MARFDISGSASRQTGLESRMRDDSIRRELDQTVAAPQQQQVPSIEPMSEYARPVTTPQEQGQLPLPMQTVDWEARKDAQGYPMVYKLPSGDMGGKYEVAGINDRYHPEAFRKIAGMPAPNREEAAAQYISQYTAPLVSQLPPSIQPFVQDMAFNRGMGGATKYIQQGLRSIGQNIAVDGAIGPKTLSAINSVNPRELMIAASQAQLADERARAAADPRRKKFMAGLENRINNRLSAFGGG
jgi:hypothetical protein